MILPIIAFGNNILKTKAVPISADYPELKTLIINMWKTMYNANGVGIAAPQIGKSIRLFIVDASPFSEDDKLSDDEISTLKNFKKVFINPEIVEETGDEWDFTEGCLSIPNIREDITRKKKLLLDILTKILRNILYHWRVLLQGWFSMSMTILKVFYLPINLVP